MAATTKRHPATVVHRTGVTRDGRIVAMDIDVLMDGGAYVTLTPVVLSRGTLHAAGVYRCDAVRVRSRAVMTHTPPNGAFRGFGAPQTIFAVERQMDRVADAVGLSPLELRRRNLLQLGDTTALDQGRITLNPVAHFEPFGFFGMVMIAIGYPFIGWGKPVPVAPWKMTRLPRGQRRRGMALVALAGPASTGAAHDARRR